MNRKRKSFDTFVREWRREYKDASCRKKVFMIAALFLILAVLYLTVGLLTGLLFILPGKTLIGETSHGALYYGAFTMDGALTTLSILGIIFVFLIMKHGSVFDKRNSVVNQDERGVNRMHKGTHGTAQEMPEEQIREVFEVNGAGDSNNIIYGQLTDDGRNVVRYLPVPYGGDLRNTIVVGPPGSQKSRCFVRVEIYNSVLRGESIVVTDPSGELFTTYGRWIPNQKTKDGTPYSVSVLNFNNYKYSDPWDCLEETIDPETGRLDDTRLSTFVSVFIANCDEGSEKNPYWHEQGIGYLKAAIGYVAWVHEINIISNLKALYLKVADGLPERNSVQLKFSGLTPITWCVNQILKAANLNGYPLDEIEKLISDIEKCAPPFTIEEVHNTVQEFEKAERDLKEKGKIPDEQPGKKAYRNVTREGQSETAKTSGIVGTLGKLSVLTDRKLTYNLSRPGIHISDINKKPMVVFLCLNDKDTVTTKPLTSLFFTFLFMNTQSNYSEAQQLAEEEGTKNPILDTNIIIDDFFSVGVIGGNPNNFTTYMSNSRKSHIFVSMIVQSISQIPSLYGQDNFPTIISDTDITLLFKAGDQMTKEYFSKESGVMTVMTEAHTERQSIWEMPSQFINISAAARPLWTPDEIGTLELNKLIIFKDGYRPLKLIKFPYTLLPGFVNQTIEPIAICNSILSYEKKLRAEEETWKTIDRRFGERIKKLTPVYTLTEDGVVILSDEDPEVRGVSLSKVKPEIVRKEAVIPGESEGIEEETNQPGENTQKITKSSGGEIRRPGSGRKRIRGRLSCQNPAMEEQTKSALYS